MAARRDNFGFESTLSGSGYLHRMMRWKADGYRIDIVYLKLRSATLALKRIASRVREGGHAVPPEDVARRFDRSWQNFVNSYRLVADSWIVYDNSDPMPRLLEESP